MFRVKFDLGLRLNFSSGYGVLRVKFDLGLWCA